MVGGVASRLHQRAKREDFTTESAEGAEKTGREYDLLMPTRRRWTRGELIKALELYRRLPFGQISETTPEIIALAEELDRSPGSVGLKLANFASLDPAQKARGITGMPNCSDLDREVWAEFEGG